MKQESAATARKPRADAVRNRERVLESAKAFSAPAAPTRAWKQWRVTPVSASVRFTGISRRARRCSRRCIVVRSSNSVNWPTILKDEREPVEALRRWLRSNVEFVATKKGMVAALALAAHGMSELQAYSSARLTKAVGYLLDRAIASGEIRSDIGPTDVFRALIGMCYMNDQPGWQASVLRLLDVFVDGLRFHPTAPSRLRRHVVATAGSVLSQSNDFMHLAQAHQEGEPVG